MLAAVRRVLPRIPLEPERLHGSSVTTTYVRVKRPPATSRVRITLRVTCGTRRARALPQTLRGDVGRSRDSKARARPTRQVHALVGRHLPAGQKSKLVKRGTAHRFSPSRYARVDRKESPAFVRLQRPHRAY